MKIENCAVDEVVNTKKNFRAANRLPENEVVYERMDKMLPGDAFRIEYDTDKEAYTRSMAINGRGKRMSKNGVEFIVTKRGNSIYIACVEKED